MKTTSEIFSANLRRLLEEKKKTQRALAKYVGAKILAQIGKRFMHN